MDSDNKQHSRFKRAWNAFFNKDPTEKFEYNITAGSIQSYSRPDRVQFTRGTERSIVNSIYNRIALDCSAIDIKHVVLDENGRFVKEKDSYLNDCLKVSANIDQTGRAFMHDVVLSMLDEGHVVIVPVDTVDVPFRDDPLNTTATDILSLRTGKVKTWYPTAVKVEVYNEMKGEKQEVILPKASVAIIENPFYHVMNQPNSTMKRLVRKMNLLDMVDEKSSSGKLDLIVQLPYVVKTNARKEQAEVRRKAIEEQLEGSKYGIAYIDSTEHITQLNRPLENTLQSQVEYLLKQALSQLGITQEIMDGTADEKVMTNYYSRLVEPIMSAIVEEMRRKFLSKTARTQGQSIMYFRNPFKLAPISTIAEMADKFTRNEIMSSNEIRQEIGLKPSEDPKADQLVNANINQSNNDPRMAGLIGQEENEEQPYE